MKRTNKLLALLLATLMVVSVLPISIAADDTAPVATDPNAISTAQEFVDKLTANPGGDYYLTTDLDFAKWSQANTAAPYVVKEFYGTLEGNGHSIKNLTLSYAGGEDNPRIGLIGHLGSIAPVTIGGDFDEKGASPVVQNLTIENMSITSTGDSASNELHVLSVGFLAGAIGSHADSAFNQKTTVISNVDVVDSTLDVTSNYYYNGPFDFNKGWMASIGVGGILGSTKTNVVIKDCSLDKDTTVTVNSTVTQRSMTVGGIIGNLGAKQTNSALRSVIDNCVNDAAISVSLSAKNKSAASGLGGIVGSAVHQFIITNCTNNGAVTMNDSSLMQNGAILGIAKLTEESFITDCKSTYNDLAIAGQIWNEYQLTYNNFVGSNGTATTLWTRNSPSIEITADNFADLGTYSNTKVYVLPKDGVIDLGNVSGNAVATFGGFLYGNGCTIKGNFTDGALFGALVGTELSFIYNLKLDVAVTNTAESGNQGALVSVAGNKAGLLVMDVDIDLNESTVAGGTFGGIAGKAYAPHIIDCTVSGTITSKGAASQVSAFIGEDDNTNNGTNGTNTNCITVMLNCENYADINLEGTLVHTAGGFVGYTGISWGQSYVNCVNYGDITSESGVANKTGSLFGKWFVGYINIIGCADYGNLSNYGIVTEDGRSSLGVNNFECFKMIKGASIRIKDYAGIRFAAKFSLSIVEKLEAEYGADAVSYGILIAPEAIVNAAGEFTTAKLDALKESNDAYADITMYSDVVADRDAWFVGVDGLIAGSITGLDGIYDMNLVGRGYIRVVVDGEVVKEIYASYADGDIANNTRSVKKVAIGALIDKYNYSEQELESLREMAGDVTPDEIFPLNDLMRPIFMNETTTDETVMFLDKGDERTLLYPIDSIISVTSYDKKTTYTEGVDYAVVNGNIKVLPNSSIPCITSATYYNYSNSRVVVDGKKLFEGESRMQPYQVRVTYTHTADWEGFLQQCQSETYASFINKLERGEDVTVFFYGDSITCGASASWYIGHEPYQWTYPLLFTQALADLYDYEINYEFDSALSGTGKVPDTSYQGGQRGTITYVNTAVGGWQSDTGKNNVEAYVKNKVKAYGCDLFILGFGMNDGTARTDPTVTAANSKIIIDEVLKLEPDANIVILSTMVAHPGSERWDGTQKDQEAELIKLAKEYRDNGVACNVCQMTSTSLAVLTRKDFRDYSANNINHPGDFFVRIYAQTLFQTVIGYDNLY